MSHFTQYPVKPNLEINPKLRVDGRSSLNDVYEFSQSFEFRRVDWYNKGLRFSRRIVNHNPIHPGPEENDRKIPRSSCLRG